MAITRSIVLSIVSDIVTSKRLFWISEYCLSVLLVLLLCYWKFHSTILGTFKCALRDSVFPFFFCPFATSYHSYPPNSFVTLNICCSFPSSFFFLSLTLSLSVAPKGETMWTSNLYHMLKWLRKKRCTFLLWKETWMVQDQCCLFLRSTVRFGFTCWISYVLFSDDLFTVRCTKAEMGFYTIRRILSRFWSLGSRLYCELCFVCLRFSCSYLPPLSNYCFSCRAPENMGSAWRIGFDLRSFGWVVTLKVSTRGKFFFTWSESVLQFPASKIGEYRLLGYVSITSIIVFFFATSFLFSSGCTKLRVGEKLHAGSLDFLGWWWTFSMELPLLGYLSSCKVGGKPWNQ